MDSGTATSIQRNHLYAYAADRTNRPTYVCLPSGLYNARTGRVLAQAGPEQEITHRCRASTFLMGGEYIQHWSSPLTYQAPKKHQYVMLKPPHTALQAQKPPRSPEEEARDILATAAKNQAEDGPSARRAAIRACKYLRAMVNQHGPLIQSAHEAAKIHTQRSKGKRSSSHAISPKGRGAPSDSARADIRVITLPIYAA